MHLAALFVLLAVLPAVTFGSWLKGKKQNTQEPVQPQVPVQPEEPVQPAQQDETVQPVGCGVQASKYQPSIFTRKLTRIIGGDEAGPHTWPWEVFLEIHFPSGPVAQDRCVANLLRVNDDVEKSDVLVTAAQCVHRQETIYSMHPVPLVPSRDKITAAIGVHDIRDITKEPIRITEIRPHPNYRDGTRDDIALLRLAEPVTFSETIRPICLPAQGEALPVGKQCAVAGWGATEGGTAKQSNVLRQLVVQVHNASICTENEDGGWGEDYVEAENICAGSLGTDSATCTGDSGGMLACMQNNRYALYGLMSFGAGERCLEAGTPDVFTRVSNYKDWIDSEIKNMTRVK